MGAWFGSDDKKSWDTENEAWKLTEEEESLKYIHQESTAVKPLICCSICGVNIENFVSEYICGKRLDPECNSCKSDHNSPHQNPFTSFSSGMPLSLVSHWLPSSYAHLNFVQTNLSLLPSLRAHYIRIPNPGGSFTAMEDVMQEYRIFLNAQRQAFMDGCKQSWWFEWLCNKYDW